MSLLVLCLLVSSVMSCSQFTRYLRPATCHYQNQEISEGSVTYDEVDRCAIYMCSGGRTHLVHGIKCMDYRGKCMPILSHFDRYKNGRRQQCYCIVHHRKKRNMYVNYMSCYQW
ncbi:uncharacterized protein LOC131958467 [Physella acuta]|uniref:uncharacterized protein LOC131958467 n=1 Tax=Physella acuta TaxID=109671 RepID=UPI0027DB5D12|nr:uncharacterized protein LOC131958467 [Physella acuta]